MAGGPATEAEVRVMWQNAVDILDSFRVHADGTQAVASTGKLDALIDIIKGQNTVPELSEAASGFRSGLSDLISPATIRSFLDPVFREHALVIDSDSGGDTYGGASQDINQIITAVYDYMVANSYVIESHGINFDSSFTYAKVVSGSANDGTGILRRLVVDENGYEMEHATIEKKHFRCIQDANSGAEEEGEVFDVVGQAASLDNLLRGSTGAGNTRYQVYSKHAGAGGTNGGSLLNNGSFDDWDGTDFSSWDKTVGGSSSITQSTAETYRNFPGADETAAGSLAITCASSDTVTLKQTLENMAVSGLDAESPYFLRVMVKGDTNQVGGNVHLRLGSQGETGTGAPATTGSMAVSSVDGTWQEVYIPLDANCWYANFNEDTLDIEVEWTGGTAGIIYFDDMLFCQLDVIDGTYYVITQAHATPVRFLLEDGISLTDAYDTSFGSGKMQTYMKLGYGRYLPHSGTATVGLEDP